MLKKIIRASAFTLAETLIVMGIVGVIAALTLPNLNSSTNNKEKVTKLQKIYSNLNDALGRAQAVYGPFDEWFGKDNDDTAKVNRFVSRLNDFTKLTKDCGITSNASCWNSTSSTYSNTSNARTVQLADGTSLFFKSGMATYGHIWVDVDGPNKGVNKPSYDQFLFVVEDNQLVPYGNTANNARLGCLSGIKSNDYYHDNYCTKWVIDNGNMDYLKCPDALYGNGAPANTQTTCN